MIASWFPVATPLRTMRSSARFSAGGVDDRAAGEPLQRGVEQRGTLDRIDERDDRLAQREARHGIEAPTSRICTELSGRKT